MVVDINETMNTFPNDRPIGNRYGTLNTGLGPFHRRTSQSFRVPIRFHQTCQHTSNLQRNVYIYIYIDIYIIQEPFVVPRLRTHTTKKKSSFII